MIIGSTFYDAGDFLLIDDKKPILGVKSVNSYSDNITGGTSAFIKQFQYSVDNGITWSDWLDLSNINLQNIITKPNHLFYIRYKYTFDPGGHSEIWMNVNIVSIYTLHNSTILCGDDQGYVWNFDFNGNLLCKKKISMSGRPISSICEFVGNTYKLIVGANIGNSGIAFENTQWSSGNYDISTSVWIQQDQHGNSYAINQILMGTYTTGSICECLLTHTNVFNPATGASALTGNFICGVVVGYNIYISNSVGHIFKGKINSNSISWSDLGLKTPQPQSILSMCCIGNTRIGYTGSDGYFNYTDNYFANWHQTYIPDFSDQFTSQVYCGSNIVILGTLNGYFYKSLNNGLSFVKVNYSYTKYKINSMTYTGSYLFTALSAGILKSSDLSIFDTYPTGGGSINPLTLNSIDLNCTYEQQSIPESYKDIAFSKMNDYYTIENLEWAVNVMKKLYDKGIMASYVNRGDNADWEDEDYIDFCWCITYIVSLLVNYDRSLANILFDKDLLFDFLEQKGLFSDQYRDLDKLTYLANNFYSEIRKRGTIDIVRIKSGDEIVSGELMRLINYQVFDEFIFCLCDPERIGWCVNRSSPMYRGLWRVTNCNKAYENTLGIIDINKYPLLNSNLVSIAVQSTVEGNISCMLLSNTYGDSTIGIGIGTESTEEYLTDLTKMVRVDPSLDYEITFIYKTVGEVYHVNTYPFIYFGVKAYDDNGVIISDAFVRVNDYTFSNSFNLDGVNVGSTYQDNANWSIARGVIYGLNMQDHIVKVIGQDLKFTSSNVKNIIPQIYYPIISGTANLSQPISIYDIKIRPLKSEYSRSFLSLKNMILMWYKNNSREKTSERVESDAIDFLLPYNSRLVTKRL